MEAKLCGRYGFIDRKGYEVIPFIYDRVTPFFKGRAEVVQGTQTFFVDAQGKIIK